MHNRFGAEGGLEARVRGRKPRGFLALVALAVGLGGCAEALPSFPIPDLIRDPRKLLSKEEQQQAINDLSEKKAAQEADAAKRAEKPK